MQVSYRMNGIKMMNSQLIAKPITLFNGIKRTVKESLDSIIQIILLEQLVRL